MKFQGYSPDEKFVVIESLPNGNISFIEFIRFIKK